jgi:hypothetical protein
MAVAGPAGVASERAQGVCVSGAWGAARLLCARCSEVDELNLAFTGSRLRDCECGNLSPEDVHIDECWNRENCGCVCIIWPKVSAQCPPANPPSPVTH